MAGEVKARGNHREQTAGIERSHVQSGGQGASGAAHRTVIVKAGDKGAESVALRAGMNWLDLLAYNNLKRGSLEVGPGFLHARNLPVGLKLEVPTRELLAKFQSQSDFEPMKAKISDLEAGFVAREREAMRQGSGFDGGQKKTQAQAQDGAHLPAQGSVHDTRETQDVSAREKATPTPGSTFEVPRNHHWNWTRMLNEAYGKEGGHKLSAGEVVKAREHILGMSENQKVAKAVVGDLYRQNPANYLPGGAKVHLPEAGVLFAALGRGEGSAPKVEPEPKGEVKAQPTNESTNEPTNESTNEVPKSEPNEEPKVDKQEPSATAATTAAPTLAEVKANFAEIEPPGWAKQFHNVFREHLETGNEAHRGTMQSKLLADLREQAALEKSGGAPIDAKREEVLLTELRDYLDALAAAGVPSTFGKESESDTQTRYEKNHYDDLLVDYARENLDKYVKTGSM